MTSQETAGAVVVARSREGNDELLAMLAKSGVPATAVETIRFEAPVDLRAVEGAVAGVSEYDWVAFTSPRAVAVFGERFRGAEGAGTRPRFAAVGPATAAALREIGLTAGFVPERFLTSELGEKLPLEEGRRVLLFRADIGDKGLVKALEKRGFEVTDVAAYRTLAVDGPLDRATVEGARLVAFASPSEVRGFASRLGSEGLARVAARATAVCIGPVTASAARGAGFNSVEFPGRHTVASLAEKIAEVAARA